MAIPIGRTSPRKTKLKVADEVWIATALLHQEHPREENFSVAEIVERAKEEALTPRLRPGVYVHALQHCVANRPPNPGRYRMLYETAEGRRRLFRTGDPYHPAREGAKIVPEREEIPGNCLGLLAWYEAEYGRKRLAQTEGEWILSLRGLGKEIWKGIDPDEYVRRLREGWE